jgi:hypothetical protein
VAVEKGLMRTTGRWREIEDYVLKINQAAESFRIGY